MKLTTYEALGEELWQETLFNGLKVIVIPKKRFSRSYAFLAVNYGGCDSSFFLDGTLKRTPAGIAHYLEHKMFDMPYGSAMETLSDLGAYANAFTGFGMTGYLFRCSDQFEDCLRVLLEYVTTPWFTRESVEKERGIIAQEIRMGEDNPASRVFSNLRKALYAVHPVREGIAGTVESIGLITPELLTACYESFYTPSNMVLCVSGAVEPERVRDLAAELVPGQKSREIRRFYGEAEGPMPDRVRMEESMPVSAPLFAFGAKLPYETDGRRFLRSLLAGTLAMEMLMGESSELYESLYAEGLINPNFSSGASDFPGGAYWVAGGESRDPAAVLDRVTAAAAHLREKGGEALFERLKKAMLGSSIRALDSVENLCHNEAEAYFQGYSAFETMDILLSVTIEDARAFLRDYFSLDRIALSVIRPAE